MPIAPCTDTLEYWIKDELENSMPANLINPLASLMPTLEIVICVEDALTPQFIALVGRMSKPMSVTLALTTWKAAVELAGGLMMGLVLPVLEEIRMMNPLALGAWLMTVICSVYVPEVAKMQ